MRPVPETRVFTTEQAAGLGWSPDALKHAVRAGRLFRVRRGIYTSQPPGPIEYACAAALLTPTAAVSHRSAVLLRSLPLIGPPPPMPELTVPPAHSRTTCRAHVYEATLDPIDVSLVDPDTADLEPPQRVRVTSPARTFVDIARHHPLSTAVVVGDAVLRGGTPPAAIDDVLRRCWNWPGIRRAEKAQPLLNGRAESPLESLSRLAIAQGGLPEPVLQQDIYNEWNGFLARTDFYWDAFGVVGEADGALKYDDRRALVAEKRRQERLEQLGLIVVRWGWREAVATPHELVRRLASAFTRGLARDGSGLPRQWVLGAVVSAA